MPCRLVFRCEICGVEPDTETQTCLEEQLLHPRFGEYVDGEPSRWLIWHGRGLYGRTLYSCDEHRGELKAFLREHYGTIGPHHGPFARLLAWLPTEKTRAGWPAPRSQVGISRLGDCPLLVSAWGPSPFASASCN